MDFRVSSWAGWLAWFQSGYLVTTFPCCDRRWRRRLPACFYCRFATNHVHCTDFMISSKLINPWLPPGLLQTPLRRPHLDASSAPVLKGEVEVALLLKLGPNTRQDKWIGLWGVCCCVAFLNSSLFGDLITSRFILMIVYQWRCFTRVYRAELICCKVSIVCRAERVIKRSEYDSEERFGWFVRCSRAGPAQPRPTQCANSTR